MSAIVSLRRGLGFTLLGVGLVLQVGARGQSEQNERSRPHLLLAIADDWGFPHAGAYGDPVVKTPTFDRVAGEGVLFRAAFVSSPSCTPSRAALLTGQYHWRLEESANLHSTLHKRFAVYPDLLEQAGYFVGHTGKGWGPGRIEPGGRSRNPAGPRYESFSKFLDQRPEDQPFCFWFGSHDPHRGYRQGSGTESGMDLSKIRLLPCFPDVPEIRSDVADYYFEVQRFDRQVGDLLDLLGQRGLLDETLVVVTGDHGMPFPRCKANLYDSGTRVPLALRWPRSVPGGRMVDDLVSLTDLAPTFLEAAGAVVPEEMTGQSLLGLLRSEASGIIDPEREFVLIGKERHVPCQEAPDRGGTPMRGLRTREFLYIRNFRPDRWPAGTPDFERASLPGSWYGDCDNGPTKSWMVEHEGRDESAARLYRLAFARRPAEELYDLDRDPGQLVNVAEDPAYAAATERLAERLIAELKASADPRVVGGAERFDTYPYTGGTPRAPGWKER